jgi:hypothetical protein
LGGTTPAPTGDEETVEQFLQRTLTDDGSLTEPGTPQNDALIALETNFPDLSPSDGEEERRDITQIFSLNTIFFATNGTMWRLNTDWLGPAPLCGDGSGQQPWFGVFCDPEGNVVDLTIVENDLMGQLPSEIRGLSSLRTYMNANGLINMENASECAVSHLSF